MGQFSWMYADTNNKLNLLGNGEAWLLQPDGNHIHETNYDDYGRFCGHDVYDLVVDWNREHLNDSMLRKPSRKGYAEEKYYLAAMGRYNNTVKVLEKCAGGATDEEMATFCKEIGYGHGEWKRSLGIDIACHDEQNAALPYPIKICQTPCDYDSVPASNDDPNQGWYRDGENDEEEDDWWDLK